MKWPKIPPSGARKYREFTLDGLHHHVDCPAPIILDLDTGVIVFKACFNYGLMHRNHGLRTHIERSLGGRNVLENYFSDDRLHPHDGPAVVARSALNGEILHSVWALSGKEYSNESA